MHTLQRTVLSNGLVLLTVHQPALTNACLTVFVPRGAWYDPPRKEGLAHFHEHMIFRGTQAHPSARAFSRALREISTTFNASTCQSNVEIIAACPTRSVGEMCRHIGDVIVCPAFDGIDVERRVVQQELRECLDPNGRELYMPRLAAIGTHGKGAHARSILGTAKTITALTLDDLRRRHARHFVARHMIVTLASSLSHEEAQALAAASFGRVPQGDAALSPPRQAPGRLAPAPRVWTTGMPNAGLDLVFPGDGPAVPGGVMPDVVTELLAYDASSRLWQAVREERGLAYDVDAFVAVSPFSSQIQVSCDVAHEAVPEAARVCLDEIARLAWEGPTAEEMAAATHDIEARHDGAEADADVLVTWYEHEEYTGTRRSFADINEGWSQATADEVRTFARQWFAPANLYVSAVANLRGRVRREFDALPAYYAEAWERERAASAR